MTAASTTVVADTRRMYNARHATWKAITQLEACLLSSIAFEKNEVNVLMVLL